MRPARANPGRPQLLGVGAEGGLGREAELQDQREQDQPTPAGPGRFVEIGEIDEMVHHSGAILVHVT